MPGKDTYDGVIWDLIEDTQELSEETIKQIEKARKEVKEGRFYTLEEVMKEIGD